MNKYVSPRFVRVVVIGMIILALFAAAWFLVPHLGTSLRFINTAGKIVFVGSPGNSQPPEVWITDDDGSNMAVLTKGEQSCSDPSFSPNGAQIAYVSDKSGQSEVYVMDADGKNAHAVTIGSAAKSSPEYTPDGKTVSYISQGTVTDVDLDSNDSHAVLPTAQAATSTGTSALSAMVTAPVAHYAWSPAPGGDVTKDPELAAVQEDDSTDQQVLSLLTRDGAAPKVLIAASQISFAWSPDASQLFAAAMGVRAGNDQRKFSGILTFNADGSAVQRAPFAASGTGSVGPENPITSPDSTQLAFQAVDQPDLAHRKVLGLFLQALDGSAPTEMISGPVEGQRWSPDGVHILLLLPSGPGGARDLWVGPVDRSSQPSNLTRGKLNVLSAEWSPAVPKTAQ